MRKRAICTVVMVNDYPYCALRGADPVALEAVKESARAWARRSGLRLPDEPCGASLTGTAYIHSLEVPLHPKNFRTPLQKATKRGKK